MKAIVSVIGKDHIGIIANVCSILARNSVNILDINQTVFQDNLTMMMFVDTEKCTVPFSELSEILRTEGEREQLSIRIQREDIFDAMHRI